MALNGAVQSGTVTSFSGATGLLQALLDFVSGTKVEGAATAGSGSGPYTATLTTTVGLGSVLINYAVGSENFIAQDDGVGGFNDDSSGHISSASVDYSTGALSVTFDTTPDASPTIDYVYGDDGQDWEVKYNRNTRDNNRSVPGEPFGSTCKEVILQNRGLSGQENVLIGIREWEYLAGDAHGWDLTGYTSYADDMYWGTTLEDSLIDSDGYSGTWEHFSETPILPLIDDTMYYWFYSNRQRIIVIVKVQSNYESCYLGFANRVGNPSDYPNPLVIKGCGVGNINYSNATETSHAFLPYSHYTGTRMLHNVLPSNAWSRNWGGTGLETFLFPWGNWANTGVMNETPNKKEVLMTPVIGISEGESAVLFEFDGIYHVAGVGVQSEDLIRASDGVKYRAFQNVSRTSYDDWMGIEEEEYTTTSTSTTTTTTSTTTTTTV